MPSLTKSILAALVVGTAALAGPASAQDVLRSGKIEGASGHTTTGTVSIVRDGGATKIVFSDDYTLDNAPDPYVAFGSASAFAKGTDFAKMSSTSGGQTYKVPDDLDPSEYEAVWLWCKRFGVPLGYATLN